MVQFSVTIIIYTRNMLQSPNSLSDIISDQRNEQSSPRCLNIYRIYLKGKAQHTVTHVCMVKGLCCHFPIGSLTIVLLNT